eukprot:CAMPEP_0204362020 /NCGR_PEP_ID=MMETSP0469-20131031/39274_1 /ASSEMBLY_ACC=CAM_ASM_000384 /TAXON_ID=2969 /ORGANISM="Oxyrrhis marina" /LENGTH=283 /DNA_ID=CAMNT_0051350521 /DNA_START=123 /DNA_END=974 /DNA_ORIENTATION=+
MDFKAEDNFWTSLLVWLMYAFSLLAHLASLRICRSQDWAIYLEYASCCGFLSKWWQQCKVQFQVGFTIVSVWTFVASSLCFALSELNTLDAVVFVCSRTAWWMSVVTSLFVYSVAISFCGGAVDKFAQQLVAARELGGLTATYNVLSAVVRRMGFALEFALLVVTQVNLAVLGVAVSFLLTSPSVTSEQALDLASCALWLVLTFALFNSVAVVNLKFERLPTLANARNFGLEIDTGKLCFVHCLESNDAGLKMYNVRIDRRTIMKVTYYSVAVLATMAPRLFA